MLLSTNLCPQTCIFTPHQSTLLPCEIPLVGWSPPLWLLLRAGCLGPHAGWLRASPRVRDTAALLGILLTPVFNNPLSKKANYSIKSKFLMFQHIFNASLHLWEKLGSIFSSHPSVAAHIRGVLPEATSP